MQAHPLPDKEHFSITVAGQTYTERKAAGQAIIDACTKMTDVAERVPPGRVSRLSHDPMGRYFHTEISGDNEAQPFPYD